jgi:hypothetical protein
MRRGTPRRSEQNQLLDEEIGKIPEQLQNQFSSASSVWYDSPVCLASRKLFVTTQGHHNQHAPKASLLVVTARDFSKVEESDCFVNEAWYSTPQ